MIAPDEATGTNREMPQHVPVTETPRGVLAAEGNPVMEKQFVRVCRMRDVAPGEMKLVDVDGAEAVVANVGGRFCAFGATCTHEEGPLVEGELDGDSITCPWHFTQFSVLTGEVIEGLTDDPIPVYEIRVDGDDVLIRKP